MGIIEANNEDADLFYFSFKNACVFGTWGEMKRVKLLESALLGRGWGSS
jgi:hypothetical protein